MPGHYVPGGGLSRTAHNYRAMPHRDTGHRGSKMDEFISWAKLPLIFFFKARMVLIKEKKEAFFPPLLFILNHRSTETVIAAKENIIRNI